MQSVTIETGECTRIVGPSGSGKTTLLNLVGGLDLPTSGTVQVDGTDIGRLRDGQRIAFKHSF